MKPGSFIAAKIFITAVCVWLGGCESSSFDDVPPSIGRPTMPPVCAGGCTPPPVCGEPEDFCTCGCIPGEIVFGMVCTDRGCLAPMRFDSSLPDASQVDASTLCNGLDFCNCSGLCRPTVDLAEGCFCEADEPFDCSGEAPECVCGGARYAGCFQVGSCPQRIRCGSCGTVIRNGCAVCDPACGGDAGVEDDAGATRDAAAVDAALPADGG